MGRRKTRVHVVICALDRGQTPLLTGLCTLARRGEIRFEQELQPWPPRRTSGPWHIRDKHDSSLFLTVDGNRRAYIDIHDAWDIEEPEARQVDVYIKRSFDPRRVPSEFAGRVFPFGLLNEVRSDGFDRFEASRILRQVVPWKQRTKEFAQFLAKTGAAYFRLGPRTPQSLLHQPPTPEQAPRVQFNAMLWNPEDVPADDPQKRAEFAAINEMRVSCVRLLRRELSNQFSGGALHSSFARRTYPDALLPDASMAKRRRFVDSMRATPIGIATTGLHGSNGFKIAEYVSLSRAIISEPLQFTVPGRFVDGENYLGFRSPEQCLERAAQLLRDARLRGDMMMANYRYYHQWMRPDVLARRVIEITRSGAESGPAPMPA